MLKRALILSALALALPAPAFAGTFSKSGSDLVYTGTGVDDQLSGYNSSGTLVFSTFTAGTTATVASGCVFAAANWNCPSTGYTRLVVRGNGGDDAVHAVGPLPGLLDGGEGDDILDGFDEADTLAGGGGDDWLRGGGAADILSGGAGADRLEGGTGGDSFAGGDGVDVVNYFYATANTNVSIDGAANDGEAGEHDNVLADVEDLWGSPQQDTLTGSAGPNTIRGGNGNDTITGLGGRDTLAGEAGSDAMFARDGAPDEVDCGSPGGSAQIDLIDDAAKCAPVDASDEAQPDHDGDGVDRPADCDDGNAARRPGCSTSPRTASTRTARARTRRSSTATTTASRCRATATTGARRSTRARASGAGNRTDENCDGRAQPDLAIGVVVGDAWDDRAGRRGSRGWGWTA